MDTACLPCSATRKRMPFVSIMAMRHFGQLVQPRMAGPELAPLGSRLRPLDGSRL
jgi:hypothetical protein